MPEALRAAEVLERSGIAAEVVCVTSADLLFRAHRSERGLDRSGDGVLAELFPVRAPVVTVLDGHPHVLAFLGAALRVASTPLGVDDFGQSGAIDELYEHYEVDTETIVGAALDLIGR